MSKESVFKFEIPVFNLAEIDGKKLRMIVRADVFSGLVFLGGYDEETGKTYVLSESKQEE